MPNNYPNRQANYNTDINTRREMMQRRAAKEKRRKMLRRNRIISTIVIAVIAIAAIFGIVKLIGKKAGNANSKVPQSSSAVTSDTSAVSDTNKDNSASVSQPISEVSSIPTQAAAPVAIGEWNMLLANANNPISEGYVPEVVKVDAAGHEFDKRAAEALTNMIKDGNATGLKLMICSAYRSTERQTKLFNDMKADFIAKGKKEDEAYAETKKIRAVPGTSEHETGLAADIVSETHQSLEDSFDTTKEFAWLNENAYKYGFILRYPREKSAITGIIYEPWHYRYVGVEAAKQIKDKGICLEEFIDEVMK